MIKSNFTYEDKPIESKNIETRTNIYKVGIISNTRFLKTETFHLGSGEESYELINEPKQNLTEIDTLYTNSFIQKFHNNWDKNKLFNLNNVKQGNLVTKAIMTDKGGKRVQKVLTQKKLTRIEIGEVGKITQKEKETLHNRLQLGNDKVNAHHHKTANELKNVFHHREQEFHPVHDEHHEEKNNEHKSF
jgi:hypothetical protein